MLRLRSSAVFSSVASSHRKILKAAPSTYYGVVAKYPLISHPNYSPSLATLSRQSIFATRCSSSESGNTGSGKKETKSSSTSEEEMSQELVLTPGQKVVAGTRLAMWTGIFAFASICAYYIGKELFPSKMSPNAVFDKAFSIIRDHPEVIRLLGAPLKAYGRDHGGHREGRRNFIEHTEYVSNDDGSKRTRVRFNLEGQFGTAFVFAEVSAEMNSGEFVYILVQDKRSGRVVTVIDNRSALTAARLAGGNKESLEVMSNLLGGSKSGKS